MIRALLERIWQLPWPPWLRRHTQAAASLPVLRFVLFPHFLVGVVGIIRDDGGNVLLLHHTYRETPWGLPTGFLERGEEPVDALRREILEESGLEVELDPRPMVFSSPDRPLLNIIFRGTLKGGSFEASTEVSQARLFPLDQLPSMLPAQRDLLTSIAQEVPH